MIYIGIYGNIYEVSKYISKHPGEGIRNVYLREFKNKDVTNVFDRIHFTEEAHHMLESAKRDGVDIETGIRYICPFFFKRRIPKYFYVGSDVEIAEYMNSQNNGEYIISPSNRDIMSELCFIYKNSTINKLYIKNTEDGWKSESMGCEIYVENIIKRCIAMVNAIDFKK